jgi:hypothetical protein
MVEVEVGRDSRRVTTLWRAIKYTYGHSRPGKKVLGMSEKKHNSQKLAEENGTGAGENRIGKHLPESV